MRIQPSGYKSIFLLSFLALLAGCSPSEKSKEAKDEASTAQENQEPSQETMLAADGWRKGTLHIEVEIIQSGDQHEAGNSQWASTIKAVSDAKVMLAPDLSPFVSSDPIKVEDVNQYEPFRVIDINADTVVSSEASHTAKWLLESDGISDDKQGEFTGKVNRVYLQSLNPSLYGPGYDAYLKINVAGKMKTKETLGGKGQPPVTTESEKDTEQEIVFFLHPVPNKDKLNDYPYIPPTASEELKQEMIKRNMETLSILNQLYADSLPVQGEIRAGMKTEATKDKLEMSYTYTGNKEVGYAAMLGVTSGMANTNKTNIKITLTADK